MSEAASRSNSRDRAASERQEKMRFELERRPIVPPPYGWNDVQLSFKQDDFPGALLLDTMMVPVTDLRDPETIDGSQACGMSAKIEFWTDFIVIREQVLPTMNGRIVPKVIEYDNGFEVSWLDNANRKIDQPVSYFISDDDEEGMLEIYMNADEQIHRDNGPALISRVNNRRCVKAFLNWYNNGECYHFFAI